MPPVAVVQGPSDLREWRLLRRWTQAEAERWYAGRDNGGRTWRRWEVGDRAIPRPLLARIRELDRLDSAAHPREIPQR